MDYFKLSLVLLLSFEFVYVVNSNPITSLFGKSDDKAEGDDKATATVKSAGEVTTTTTAGPSSSCGGLKGFLHICDKTEATEPPKSVKTRSVPEVDDSDESKSDSDSEEDSDEKKPSEGTPTDSVSEGTEKVAKRQADDLDASETSETPEETSNDTPAAPEIPALDELAIGLKKRQADESDSGENPDSDENTEGERKRRDCRDRPEDQWKDCKK